MYFSFSIKVSDDKSYILMTIRGSINKKIGHVCACEAKKVAARHGIRIFLQDLRGARNIDCFAEKYNFISENIESACSARDDSFVILVVDRDDHSHDFIEKMSRANGPLFRISRSMDEALKLIGSAHSIVKFVS